MKLAVVDERANIHDYFGGQGTGQTGQHTPCELSWGARVDVQSFFNVGAGAFEHLLQFHPATDVVDQHIDVQLAQGIE